MKVTIESVENGFKVEHEGKVFVYELDENETPIALQSALWAIVELLGESGTRYDKERIRISLVRGDKYEGEKDDQQD